MPYRRPRRSPAAVRRLFDCRLSLVRQPALSQVPVHGSRSLAQQASGQPVARAYSHVVFTLPEQRAPLALPNQRLLYDLLFRAASETLLQIAADPRHLGERIGSSPYSIPGARTCVAILTCIAWSIGPVR
jgi:hypothetical protein